MGEAYLASMLLQLPEIPVLLLCVTRENIVRNTIEQLSKYRDLELKKPLRVRLISLVLPLFKKFYHHVWNGIPLISVLTLYV